MESRPSKHKIDCIKLSNVNILSIVYACLWSYVNFLGLVDVQTPQKLQPDQNATEVSENIFLVIEMIYI